MTKKIVGVAFLLGIIFGILFLIKFIPIYLAVSDMENKMSECISNYQQYTAGGCKTMFKRIIDAEGLEVTVDDIKIEARVGAKSTVSAEWIQPIDIFGIWTYYYPCKPSRSGRVPDRMCSTGKGLYLMSIGASLRRHFLTGSLVLVPVSITLWLMLIIARFVVRTLNLGVFPNEVPEVLASPLWLKVFMKTLFETGNFLTGFLITLVLVIVTGALVRTFVGRRLITYWEGLIDRIPFIRGVYGAVKQLTETMFAAEKHSFARVVLIEYPRPGLHSLAFVTGPTIGKIAEKFAEQRMLNVFIPSTPNPTTGYYLVIKEKDAIPMDLTPEQAFRIIISGGLSTGEERSGNSFDVLDKKK